MKYRDDQIKSGESRARGQAKVGTEQTIETKPPFEAGFEGFCPADQRLPKYIGFLGSYRTSLEIVRGSQVL